MKLKLFIAFALLWFLFIREGVITYGHGITAPSDPIQEELNTTKPFVFKGYNITPLADFQIEARVLSRERYYFDGGAELSPIDFALGWGRMSDEKNLDEMEITQSGRWYFWKSQYFPIPRQEIERHSANMHLIPKDSYIESTLLSTKKGEIVQLNGYLVRIDREDGFNWSSSLTRDDTGNHSCELFFVNSAKTIYPLLYEDDVN